jgi:hypothetical protein
MTIIKDKFGRKIRLTDERLQHIFVKKEMKSQKDKIVETLKKPDIIKKSLHNENVLIFYKWYQNTPVASKYLSVVVKYKKEDRFILTAFFTDKIKVGEVYEENENMVR